MFPNPDTCYAVLKSEHAVVLRRAERRALHIEAASRPRSAPVATPAEPASVRRGRLARAIRSLHWVLRPAHA